MSKAILLLAAALAVGCQSKHDLNDEVMLTHSKADASEVKNEKQTAEKKAKVPLATDMLATKSTPVLKVTSSAFADGAIIPATYADYGEKSSPPLMISGIPESAKSLVIICEDPDAAEPKPFNHWVIWNVPANFTTIRTAVPGTGQVRELGYAKQGPNSFGSTGYYGPHPPAGDVPHHYYFQVFAVDRMLEVEQGAMKDDVLAAAKGHVVAAGEIVGLFAKPKAK